MAVLLEAPALDAALHMALDEAVLDASAPGETTLRIYRWSGPALTFGYFQAYEEVRGRSRGLAMVRRMTGGGIVAHDGDVTFSLVFPWDRLTAASWIYKEVHRGVHLGLKARGVRSRLWSPPKAAQGPVAECFVSPSPMDLVREDGSKALGGALRRSGGMGLYQGSLRPEGLGEPERLAEAVVDGVGEAWGIEFRKARAGRELLAAAERLAAEKYRTEAWNKRR
jgi:lipoate-protein ligase A